MRGNLLVVTCLALALCYAGQANATWSHIGKALQAHKWKLQQLFSPPEPHHPHHNSINKWTPVSGGHSQSASTSEYSVQTHGGFQHVKLGPFSWPKKHGGHKYHHHKKPWQMKPWSQKPVHPVWTKPKPQPWPVKPVRPEVVVVTNPPPQPVVTQAPVVETTVPFTTPSTTTTTSTTTTEAPTTTTTTTQPAPTVPEPELIPDIDLSPLPVPIEDIDIPSGQGAIFRPDARFLFRSAPLSLAPGVLGSSPTFQPRQTTFIYV